VARIKRPAFLKLLREEPVIALGIGRALVATIRDIQSGDDETVPDSGRLPATQPALQESLAAAPDARADRAWAVGKSQRAALPLLASVPLFHALPRRHLRRIARIAELRRYAGHSTVVLAGAHGAFFRIILEGQAQVVTGVGHDRLLLPGDFFGELSLFDGAPRAASVVALGGLTVVRIARPAFLKLLREEPTIAVGVVQGLVAVVRDLQRPDT
jgi:hypothetical protein